MELIKGVPITEFCDKNKLTTRQRLELFIPVCQAIQHAHMKGIIHRDIKPSNVMIALYDGKPTPKVIDFGVAKAMAEPLTQRTLFTNVGQIVGTFEYMSPEQATLNQLDIDTRSDIYSLGVLLYELLTGLTPIDKERLRTLAFDQMLHAIREEEPMRPSARLTSTVGALANAAMYRGVPSQKLADLLRGEIDWIVMKCLEKDRDRRFLTATSLAQDIGHYLRDEPVSACPPTVGYRLRKFLGRHKGPALTAAMVMAAVLAGMVGTSWGWIEALAQRDDAVQARKDEAEQRRLALANEAEARHSAKQEKAARKVAESEKKEADLARKQAQKNENLAEWRLYAWQISLAQKAWETHNIPLLYHYLGQCRMDFRGWEHDYLFTLANAGNRVLSGHTAYIFDVAFSPDGTLLASAGGTSGMSEIHIWDARSGKLLQSLKGHTRWVRSVSFSPDGKRLATSSGDKSVKVWDLASGKDILALEGHQGTVWKVAFSPDGKLLASVSGSDLKLWDANTGDEKASLSGHTNTVYGVAFSPDGKRLASGSLDKTVKLWDLATCKEILELASPMHMTYARLAFSRDGKLLVCRAVNAAKVWDTENWQDLRTFDLEGSGTATFSADGKILACGADNNSIKLMEIASGREIRSLYAHTGNVVGVAYSPDGKRLASGGGGVIRLWDLEVGQETRASKGSKIPSFKTPAFARSSDGSLLAKVTDKKSLQVFDAASGKPIVTLEEEFDEFGRLAFSPDGKRLVSIKSHDVVLGFPANDELKVWDLAGGKALDVFKRDLITRVVISPDSSCVAVVSTPLNGPNVGHDELLLWHLDSGKKTRVAPESRIGALVFSSDSRRLAIAWAESFDRFSMKTNAPVNNQIDLWSVGADNPDMTLRGHNAAVRGLTFSSDGRRLASASTDKTIKLWDTASGQAFLTLSGHTDEVQSVAFSPDGKRLASASKDRIVKLWDTTSGQEVLSLTGSGTNLTFSPDGKQLSARAMFARLGAQPSVSTTWDASKSMKEPPEK